MSNGWRRVSDCLLCGSPRCVVSTANFRLAYCFRYGKKFFINKDSSTKDNRSKENKVPSQIHFDFDEGHLQALEG